ncbi:MAG: glycosyltransferase, partial [Dehalococcoidia bacterium]|nr:glycosyltransferase [Dehalococcoidia bacterium]
DGEKPDIIHAHGWMLYSVLPLIAKARIPVAYTLHDYRLFCPKMIPVKQNAICNESFTRDCIFCLRPVCGLLRAIPAYVALKRNASKLESVSKFIALNPQIKEDHMKHLGIGSSKIEIIPNFCDSTTNSDKRGYEDLPDEFIMFAGHHHLDNLIAIVDRNMVQSIDFTEDAVSLEPFRNKWEAFNWNVSIIDGHSFSQILTTLNMLISEKNGKPKVVIAKTIKGKGISYMENKPIWHYRVPDSQEEIEQARKELAK